MICPRTNNHDYPLFKNIVPTQSINGTNMNIFVINSEKTIKVTSDNVFRSTKKSIKINNIGNNLDAIINEDLQE